MCRRARKPHPGPSSPSCTSALNPLSAQLLPHTGTSVGAQQELLVGLAQFGVAQQEETSVFLRERVWLAQETHIHVLQQAIPLFPVAAFAAGHQVLPRRWAASRARNDMVERQVATAFTAILAGFIIAQQDIRPRGLKSHAGHSHIGEQLHNDRAFQVETSGLNTLFDQLADAVIDERYFLLREQHNQTALRNDR